MRVVAFTKYDREAASTRQRYLQYAPSLAKAGIELSHRALLSDDYVRSLATGESWSKVALLRSYVDRMVELFRGPAADLVWVHAELFPYLPSAFDSLTFRARLPVVCDWDDALFLKYNTSRNPLTRWLLAGKLERLIARAEATTCGNQFLRDYAAQYCARSILLPTVVDIDVYVPRPQLHEHAVIGWIGSPTNWDNVRPVLPIVRAICAETGARFRVVGAGVRAEQDRFAEMELVDWTEAGEVAEVQGFDIGIMPLVDAPFERGKSAYKLVQYMGCGVPAVASPVGANRTVLSPSCGMFAHSASEWDEALRRLLADGDLRRRMGEQGRERAVADYSLQTHAPRLIALFNDLAGESGNRRRVVGN